MNISKLLKTINKVFPGTTIIKETKTEVRAKITPSEAGRILAACKKVKKKSGQVDKNQLVLF